MNDFSEAVTELQAVLRRSQRRFGLRVMKRALEAAMVGVALEQTGGNQSKASRVLGVHRNTPLRAMARCEIPKKRSWRREFHKTLCPHPGQRSVCPRKTATSEALGGLGRVEGGSGGL